MLVFTATSAAFWGDKSTGKPKHTRKAGVLIGTDYGERDKIFKAWNQAEHFIDQFEPEFILLQSGADSLEGDPITDMKFSADAHAHATRSLVQIANKHAKGRLLVMGGGGYNHDNIAQGWTAVVDSMVKS